jgi:outer membrane protein OmpA-like peptidoglycan-associated protein
MSRYTQRPDVTQKNYTQKNIIEDRMDAELYEQYEEREPCQYYRRLPRNYTDACRQETVVEAEAMPVATKIIRSYTILFDHDKSEIRYNENETLDRAMKEIKKYNPRKVTVTGYTDSTGAPDYNQKLSSRREQAVSKALLSRGIESKSIDRQARGEYNQAVPTADGVKNQSNRRVVIDFHD